jgi:hypothetical protein
LNCRSERRSIFRIPLRDNPLLVLGVIGTQALQVAVLGIPPIRDMLALQDMDIATGLSLAVGAIGIILVMEIYKRLRR